MLNSEDPRVVDRDAWIKERMALLRREKAVTRELDQIRMHDATLIAVSSAPTAMLEAVKAARGWDFQWASSYRSGFNSDFHMSAPADCTSKQIGDEIIGYDRGESGGINVFVKNEAGLFHTYSAYNRGIQQMNGAFGYVDLLPYGGN